MPRPLREVLNSGKFVVTAEIGPPKGTNLETMIHHIDLLKDKVDALNVTDNQSSVMRYPSVATAIIIQEHGGEITLSSKKGEGTTFSLSFPVPEGERKLIEWEA